MTFAPGAVLDFWFSDLAREKWFESDPAFDELVREEFMPVYRDARAGRLARWESAPEGSLGLVITLDQFPRNMFRGQPQAFATDHDALRIAFSAIERAVDQMLTAEQRMFLYMPLMHTENLAIQERSVSLYKDLGLEESFRFAIAHRDIIAEFGRFPHRNKALGRPSTPEENRFLKRPGSSF